MTAFLAEMGWSSNQGSNWCGLVNCIQRYVWYGPNLENIWYPKGKGITFI